MGEKKNWKVKTFTTELKIFQTIKELETLDDRVNRSLLKQGEKGYLITTPSPQTTPGATIVKKKNQIDTPTLTIWPPFSFCFLHCNLLGNC